MSLEHTQNTASPLGANKFVAMGLLLFMGIVWGLSLALAKLATQSGGHPVGLALWQTFFGGTLLLTLSLMLRRPPKLKPEVVHFNLVCGFVGITLPALGLYWSATHLPAGIVAIAFASMPMLTYVISAALGIERVEAVRILGVTIGLSAVLLMVLPEGSLPAPHLAPWVLVALAASVSMSTENVYIAARRPPDLDSIPLSCGRQLAGALFLAPLAFGTLTTIPVFTTWTTLQWAATGTAVTGAIAYTTLLYVIKTSGAVFASQTAYVITLSGVLWGMAIFGERHSLYIWGALGLMMLGLMLTLPRGNGVTR